MFISITCMHIILKVVLLPLIIITGSTCLDWCSVSSVPYIYCIIAQLNKIK